MTTSWEAFAKNAPRSSDDEPWEFRDLKVGAQFFMKPKLKREPLGRDLVKSSEAGAVAITFSRGKKYETTAEQTIGKTARVLPSGAVFEMKGGKIAGPPLKQAKPKPAPKEPTKERKAELKETELAALKRFAKEQGPRWKEWLRKAWENGTLHRVASAEDVPLLQAVRNKIGPSGLAALKL